MHIFAFLFFLCGVVYFGIFGYLAWFSPKGYEKFVVSAIKWMKATSIIYHESFIDFWLKPTGIGRWSVRIIVTLGFLLSLRGLIFGIWGTIP
jgi:hypothetical protein